MIYTIGKSIADMHGTSIHHIDCIKEVLSVVKFTAQNASEIVHSMIPKESRGSFAHNKALYIIDMNADDSFIVAWHYDGMTVGIANVILE